MLFGLFADVLKGTDALFGSAVFSAVTYLYMQRTCQKLMGSELEPN